MKNKLLSMDFLRGLACILVFITHVQLKYSYGFGAQGVSIFIILSGFLLAYNHADFTYPVSFKDATIFAIRRIKKLYPLHIVTTVMMISFFAFGENKYEVKQIISRFLLNVVLLQEWIPIQDRSINPVSWYLCLMLFLYFVFPFVLRSTEKKYRENSSISIFIKNFTVLFAAQITIGMIGYFISLNSNIWGVLMRI